MGLMKDVVDRMRALAHPHYEPTAGVSTRVGDLRDAIAEIERLRAALEACGEMFGDEGYFRRAEDIEAFLRGEKVAWLEDPSVKEGAGAPSP